MSRNERKAFLQGVEITFALAKKVIEKTALTFEAADRSEAATATSVTDSIKTDQTVAVAVSFNSIMAFCHYYYVKYPLNYAILLRSFCLFVQDESQRAQSFSTRS